MNEKHHSVLGEDLDMIFEERIEDNYNIIIIKTDLLFLDSCSKLYFHFMCIVELTMSE